MVIYEPKGKAREYAPLAANLYKGCAHGCLYCYAPGATLTAPAVFHGQPCPRRDVLRQLQADAVKFRGDKRRVLLSFTSDPYQPLERETCLTRAALEILASAHIKVAVLTKGCLLAQRDFDILSNMDAEFAVTLTSDDDAESKRWEPKAALPADRIESLRAAKRWGIPTWVSFEPVINPGAVLRLIDATAAFVDFYKVGKLNHHPFAQTIDWPAFRQAVCAKLDAVGKPYLIKKDLLEAR
ncbi:MAG: radical SAM protein [Desulfobulbaceae bacterium]|nr:radical SAM protein [Desulfobulbaceae bacterium]